MNSGLLTLPSMLGFAAGAAVWLVNFRLAVASLSRCLQRNGALAGLLGSLLVRLPVCGLLLYAALVLLRLPGASLLAGLSAGFAATIVSATLSGRSGRETAR